MSQEGSTGTGGSGTNPPNPEQKANLADMMRDPKSLGLAGIIAVLLSSGVLVSTRDLDAISTRQAVIEVDVRALRTSLDAHVDDLNEARDKQRDSDKLMIEINQRLKSIEKSP